MIFITIWIYLKKKKTKIIYVQRLHVELLQIDFTRTQLRFEQFTV